MNRIARWWAISGLLWAVWSGSAAAANLDAGRALVMQGAAGVTACQACHGAAGQGNREQGYPRLAGLATGYLSHELNAFRAGQRENAIMAPIAKALTATQVADVSAWLGSLPAQAPVASRANVSTLRRGERLVEFGRWSRRIPACDSCHGAGARGVGAHFPRLAGQYASYTETQLHEWRRGFRTSDPDHLMRSIASRMTDEDMRSVAAYLQTLPRERALTPAPPVARVVPRYPGYFEPPPRSALPAGPLGRAVRAGLAVFDDTPVGARPYVGDALSCRNCHLDGGRLAGASPMWAAYVAFPAYRAKNHRVNTLTDRIQGCFRFSENGQAPPADSAVMTHLIAYFAWLSQGAPVGADMPGRGYPKLAPPPSPPSPVRGHAVYVAHCAMCHGADGEGVASGSDTVFPPLWGPRSFNGGAGMHVVKNAAAFIHANMPYGRGGTLSDQDAWDVAAYIDSKPRPRNPRMTGHIVASGRAR